MNYIRKIRQTGWKYSIAIVFNRIVPQWLFRVRRFVVYRLNEIESFQSEIDSDVSVSRCIDESEIVEVEALTYFKRTYSTGQLTAWQGTIDGRLVAGMWAATEAFDENELGVRLKLGEAQAWLFAALVSNEVRGRGIYSTLLPSVMSDLASQGFVKQIVAVNPDNHASNQIHKRMSSSTVGQVLAVRFVKFVACWTSGDIKKERTISWDSTTAPIELRFDDR